MTIVTTGVTRTVLLTRRYAFKVPNVREWRMFLSGLLANLHEQMWYDPADLRMCPIVFGVWGGFLNVMRRAEPVSDATWAAVRSDLGFWSPLPVDCKRENFGVLDGRPVLVDYGS